MPKYFALSLFGYASVTIAALLFFYGHAAEGSKAAGPAVFFVALGSCGLLFGWGFSYLSYTREPGWGLASAICAAGFFLILYPAYFIAGQ